MKDQHRKTHPIEMTKELSRLNFGMGLGLFFVVAFAAMVVRTNAASVLNKRDTLSNQSSSGTSTHTVTFNLSVGNAFSAGEQVAIDFPHSSAFTQGGTWATSDFAFNDGVARTIDAVNAGAGVTTVTCADGANNVGVAIDTTALAFRAIPCGGAFSASATGALVTFVISGQAPGGTLTNPSSVGSYIVSILSAGGDCGGGADDCRLAVAIADSSDVGVTATVTGGGGGGPPPDTTPPTISNISVTAITGTSATVNWNTDETADSTVNYGVTVSYGSQAYSPALLLSHSMNLTGLTDGTLYHFQVCSRDGANNQACSTDQTFTTLDTTPPNISNVAVTNITQTGATIAWTTNESATSFVDYDLAAGPPYGSSSGTSSPLVTSHSVTLTGLTASTTYHYRVRSGDASSNESFTTDATFITSAPPDATPPVISNVAVSAITGTSATVTWTTDEPGTNFVDYGTTVSYGSTAGSASPLQTSHSVNLTGLSPQTTYHFRVRSADAASNEAASGNQTFSTLDVTAPVISNVAVSAITGTSATVTWTTDEPGTNFVDYGTTVSYGSTAGSASPLQTSHSVNLTGLSPQTAYHFRVRSADAASNEAASTDATFMTADNVPPAISNVAVSGITANSATVTWNTNEPATRFVDYGLTSSYGSTAGSSTPFQTSHSVTLTGLASGTTYNFRVRSADAAGNSGSSANATFATTGPDVTVPTISNVAVSGITANSATVTWNTNEPATRFVDYGTTVSYGSTAGSASPLQTSHSVTLTGLSAATTYHYRVRSADAAANEAASADLTFSTIDSDAPVISNVAVTSIDQAGATITWTTNEGADSSVDYGTTVSYGSTAGSATPVTGHMVPLTGLVPATTYHFRVKSADASNNQATSGDFTFTTLPPPPVISNVAVTNVTQTTARVTWTTDVPSDSKVDFGLAVAYGSTRTDSADVTSHQIDLTGLTKNTTYHYRVRSERAGAEEGSSSDATFMTAADVTPPANVSPFIATPGNSSVSLSWGNPADPDFDRVNIRRKLGSNPTGPADGTEIYNGNGTSFVDTGLANGTEYFYGAFAYDDVPNFASGAFASATPSGPPDVTPPPDVSGFVAAPGNQQNALSWTNPVDPDFVGVRVLRKATGFPTGPSDGVLVYSGAAQAHLDTGLTNGILYYYKAFSFDGALNFSAGVEAQGTPAAPPDSTPPSPVTNFVAAPGDASVRLSWTNPASPDWAGTRIVRKVGSNPTGPGDGGIAYDGMADNWLDTGLANGTEYRYSAYAYDAALNFATPAFANATPEVGAVPPPLACSDSDGGRAYEVQGTVSASGNTYQDSCVDARTVLENYCDAGMRRDETKDCGVGFKCAAGRCIADTVSTEVCGNGICGGSENSINCAIDCPVVPQQPPVEEPTPTVAAEDRLDFGNLYFLATSARIQLRPQEGRITAYAGMTLVVYLPDASIRKPIRTAFVNFGGVAYPMRPTRSYEASVVVPAAPGDYPLTLALNYEDGTNDVISGTIVAVPRGRVFETVDGQDVSVADARVTLLAEDGGTFGIWDGAPSGQANPAQTDELGRYNFVVRSGTYRLVIEKPGYLSRTTLAFPVSTNVVTLDLRILREPENVQEQIAAAAMQTADQIAEAIANPIVEEQAATVAAPAAAVAAVANVATTGATAVPYVLYLYTFFAHPTLLIARRRRQKWGVVYNALTKLPIDLAIVRLLDAKTGRIVRSAVTDKQGRYFFIVQPGEYRMTAVKAGYAFPSAYLKGTRQDVSFIDLYHGEVVTVTAETSIAANIPLDPIAMEKTPRKVLLEGIARRLQASLGVLSIIAMAIAVIITPTPAMIGLLVGNVALYLVFRRLAVPRKPKNWGIVYDEKTGRPMQNVVARIFESKYNKLLETQVTDIRGRYAFLVGSNVYYVTFEKPGYQKQQKGPLDLTKREAKKDKAEAELVALDVRLQASGAAPTSTGPSGGMPPASGTSRPPEPPPAKALPIPPSPPPVPSAPPPSPAKPAGSWEQQMLARLKSNGGTASAATPDRPAPMPSVPPKNVTVPPLAAGSIRPEMKLIQDAAHAHPEEYKPSDDGLLGPDDIVREVK